MKAEILTGQCNSYHGDNCEFVSQLVRIQKSESLLLPLLVFRECYACKTLGIFNEITAHCIKHHRFLSILGAPTGKFYYLSCGSGIRIFFFFYKNTQG